MTELASVHRLTRTSLKKQRAGAGFKAIKLKLGFGFDEDFWLRRSTRQAVSETMIIMVDANHACDTTATISRPDTRLRSIAIANDPMPHVLRAKSPFFARSREMTRRIDWAAEGRRFGPRVPGEYVRTVPAF
jgi:hypothetical protein